MFTENLSTWNPGNLIQWFIGMAILIVLVERSLAVVFDTKLWKWIEAQTDKLTSGDTLDIKPWICMIYSVGIVFVLHVDFFSFLFQKQFHWFTMIATGLFIAGGSKGFLRAVKRWSTMKDAIVEAKISDPLGNNK